jgi:mannosyltransferase OCH1-like enzyme
MPNTTLSCIETWKKYLPEYEFVLWDKNKFDVDSVVFTQEACSVKKWAFAADYIRLYAIFTEGGIYFDSDVYVKRSFDDFLHNEFFTSLEYHKDTAIEQNAYELLDDDGTLKNAKERIFTRGIGIQAAILGGVKGHPFLKSCLDWYNGKHFILPDGTYYNKIISPAIYADRAIDYGFRYKDELQELKNGMTIYPSYIFAGGINEAKEESYAIHCCNGSWRDRPKESIATKIKRKLSRNNFLRKISGKQPYTDHFPLNTQ